MNTPAPATKPRKPRYPATVKRVQRITPRMVRVTFTGPELENFGWNGPAAHIKLIFSTGEMRTYTPRRFDPQTRTLEVQFVLHGAGPASEWAERVQVGDKLVIAGPGGRFSLDRTVGHWWIAGDESAIPAVGTLLDALPDSAAAEVHLEVADADDEIEFASPAKTTITWHHRRAPDAWGAELDEAARAAAIPDGGMVWVACEASAMRGIRKYFLADRGLPASSLVTRGYWRVGEANHPDHDYGEDEPARS